MSKFYSLRIFERTPYTNIADVNQLFILNKNYNYLIDQLMLEVEERIKCYEDCDFLPLLSCVKQYGVEFDESKSLEDQALSLLDIDNYIDRKKVVDAFFEDLNKDHDVCYIIEEHPITNEIIDCKDSCSDENATPAGLFNALKQLEYDADLHLFECQFGIVDFESDTTTVIKEHIVVVASEDEKSAADEAKEVADNEIPLYSSETLEIIDEPYKVKVSDYSEYINI